jgi:hypothetical protein
MHKGFQCVHQLLPGPCIHSLPCPLPHQQPHPPHLLHSHSTLQLLHSLQQRPDLVHSSLQTHKRVTLQI